MKVRTIALAAALIMVASAGALKTYTVKKGDTLAKIAAKTGAKLDAIAKKNGLNKHAALEYGQKIRLPEEKSSYNSSKQAVTTKTVGKKLPAAVAIKKSNVFVRKGASTDTRAIAKVAEGSIAKVIGTAKGFYQVKFPGGTKGFVRADMTSPLSKAPKVNYISTSSVKINKDGVNIRKQPSTNAEAVTKVDKGIVAQVLDRRGEWYKLKFPKGTIGFVRGDFLNANARSRTLKGSRNYSEVYANNSPRLVRDTGASNIPASSIQIVQNAKKMLGTPYVWASESSRGVDCSGLVYYLYQKTEGITLPRTSREQSTHGKAVAKDDLRPGDTLYFKGSRSGGVNHAAIYVGGGKYIHASSSRGRVVVSDIHSSYFKSRFATARRFDSKLSKTASAKSGKSSSGKKKSASK
ncbi:MAG: NlpC/P60 family protein [Fimbriimonadales bacterium]